jgi:hypothetical protein
LCLQQNGLNSQLTDPSQLKMAVQFSKVFGLYHQNEKIFRFTKSYYFQPLIVTQLISYESTKTAYQHGGASYACHRIFLLGFHRSVQ